MADPPEPDPRTAIGGHYLVDVDRTMPEAGGGVPAYAVTDRRGGHLALMALRVERHAPARARALQTLTAGIDGLLTPLAHGLGPPVNGQDAWFVVCRAPVGPPVSAGLRPWPEPLLIEHVMRPIAGVLEQLQTLGLTHRGIRPSNVFLNAPNRPVTLGAAWAAPPAMHQPAVCETPYAALCHKAARGDGRIADDVYALGVLLATLALGRIPMEGADDAAISYRKFEIGDFAAIVGEARLPPMLADIIRGMLAEDPDHRPSPALLRDPASARGRRIAPRPLPKAQQSYKIGPMPVLNNRMLACAMAAYPNEALTAIQTGTAMYWLRRGLGDADLAVKLEELVRHAAHEMAPDKERAGTLLIMRAIVTLDPLMPLCWRGLAMFPDGLGAMLAAALGSDQLARQSLQDIIASEATGIWAAVPDEGGAAIPLRLEARQRRSILQIKGPAGGLPRLSYTLNPLAPCLSGRLAGRWIVQAGELPAALDAIAAASPDADLLDPHIVAFIAARSERRLDQEVRAFASAADGVESALSALRLLTALQQRFHPAPLTGLTAWAAARSGPLVGRWNNLARRAEVRDQLKGLAIAGFLPPILTLLDDRPGTAADAEGLRTAIADLAGLDAQLRVVSENGRQRALLAMRLGQEVAAGVGLVAIATTLILAALG